MQRAPCVEAPPSPRRGFAVAGWQRDLEMSEVGIDGVALRGAVAALFAVGRLTRLPNLLGAIARNGSAETDPRWGHQLPGLQRRRHACRAGRP